jgi:hypothetical protein
MERTLSIIERSEVWLAVLGEIEASETLRSWPGVNMSCGADVKDLVRTRMLSLRRSLPVPVALTLRERRGPVFKGVL